MHTLASQSIDHRFSRAADLIEIEIIETIRAKQTANALPIVVFTAREDEETAQRCSSAGANLVLAKSQGGARRSTLYCF